MKRRIQFASAIGLCVSSVAWLPSIAIAQPTPVAAAAPASAAPAYPPCPGVPDEQAMAAAKGAFEAGNAAFNEADYARAITYWEDAYRRDCTAHPMLKNLARAYELDGQYAAAIAALETFLARQPNANDDPTIVRRIEVLRKKVAETEPAPVAPPPDAPKAVTPEPPPPAPPRREERERSKVPLYVAGGGAVLGVLGAALWYPSYSTVQDVAEDCPDRSAVCSRADEGNEARSDATLWGIVGGVGAAVAVAGVTWYFVQGDKPAQSALSLEACPGYAGVRYSAQVF
jgi:tetratricopeptide (TPR) repeat protein